MTPRFNVVGIAVSDMARSLAFYRRLGLEIADGSDAEDHVEAVLPGGLRIAWDTEAVMRSMDPDWAPPANGSRVALAFECDSPADVDRVYGELIASGAHGHTPPWDAVWQQRYAIVHDPDGTPIDLFARL